LSASSVQRGRGGDRGGGGDKRPRPQSRASGQTSNKANRSSKSDNNKSDGAYGKKEKVAHPCDFIACAFSKNRLSHVRADCKLEKQLEEDGYTVMKK